MLGRRNRVAALPRVGGSTLLGFELVVITLWLMDGVLGKAVPQPSARWKLEFNTVGGKQNYGNALQ